MKQNTLQNSLGMAALLLTFTPACSGHLSEPANAEPQANTVETRVIQTVEATEKAPGIVVHIDPSTGQIISPPAKALSPKIPSPLDTSKKLPSELRETVSPMPGGGVTIHLGDQFMNPLSASIDPDGNVRFEHKRSGSDEKQE